MTNNDSVAWSKEAIRNLRLRMGWCKSDLARRLNCTSAEVESWELGQGVIKSSIIGDLEILLRQAEEVSEEVKYMPAAETKCEQQALDQIQFSRVKAELE